MTDPFTGMTPIIPAEDSRRSQAALDFPTTGNTLSAVFSPAAVSGNLCQFKNERKGPGTTSQSTPAQPQSGETPKGGRFSSFQMEQRREEQSELLPSQEALREGGELAFPVLDEVALGHELIELLPLL